MNLASNRPGRAPAQLAPIFMPRIWGSRDISTLFANRTRETQPIGEAWLTGDASRFLNGEFSGETLGEVWPRLSQEWTGTRLRELPRIPLLVKFLFTEDKLSVQVHPDDAYAERHEAATGGTGKTEMWYVIAAKPDAEVLVGLRDGVTDESFRRAIDGGTALNCLERIAVQAGDAIYVPAGTVHAIGPGVILCEIQEHSDITYRIFDYNRTDADGKPRPLHIRQALQVIQFDERSGGRCEPVSIARGAVVETFFAACRHFATERWEFRERIAAVTSPEHFDILIFLGGNGRIEFGEGSEAYSASQAWFLPAAMGAYQLESDSPTQLLRTYVPDLNEVVRRLADDHVAENAWSRVVHP